MALRTRWPLLATLALAACGGGTTTYDTFGGGTVSVEVTPLEATGLALAWEGAGSAVDEPGATTGCGGRVVITRDDGDSVQNSVQVRTCDLPLDRSDLCVTTADVELSLEQHGDTSALGDLDVFSSEADPPSLGFASFPELDPYTATGSPEDLEGRFDGAIDLVDPCDGQTLRRHAVVVRWAFDPAVTVHEEVEDRGGGIPGVGE